MASGIIEKSNSGLFCNEIEMNGKYATMVRFLKEEIGIFSTFREAYIAAAIIGFLYNNRGTADSSEKVQPASIFPNELSKRLPDLKMLYRIIMLADESKPYTIDEYMNRAFRDDAESETSGNLKNNMTIFNAYVCGGLEILYEVYYKQLFVYNMFNLSCLKEDVYSEKGSRDEGLLLFSCSLC